MTLRMMLSTFIRSRAWCPWSMKLSMICRQVVEGVAAGLDVGEGEILPLATLNTLQLTGSRSSHRCNSNTARARGAY
eukprot:10047726-Alexandrium_andersonii.AAC.1